MWWTSTHNGDIHQSVNKHVSLRFRPPVSEPPHLFLACHSGLQISLSIRLYYLIIFSRLLLHHAFVHWVYGIQICEATHPPPVRPFPSSRSPKICWHSTRWSVNITSNWRWTESKLVIGQLSREFSVLQWFVVRSFMPPSLLVRAIRQLSQ